MRVGVLASGTGTILESIIDCDIPVAVALADRPCRALEIADASGIPTELVDRSEFGGFGRSFDRFSYTKQVVEALAPYRCDVLCMAGFGTVLDSPIHDAYPNRILNTHPALLPLFPGWHAVQDALDAGQNVTGCTVHIATLQMDAGPILAQEEVPILENDNAERLHERIKQVERRLYPLTIRAFIAQLQRAQKASAS